MLGKIQLIAFNLFDGETLQVILGRDIGTVIHERRNDIVQRFPVCNPPVKLRTLHPKPLPAMGGSGAVPLAVYKYSRLAYQQAGKHDMSGKLHTSCILCIAKRAPSRMP